MLVPYLWLSLFFLVPFLIVLKISLSQTVIAQPPYVPVLDLAAGWQGLKHFAAHLSLDNYALLGSDDIYLCSYLKSLKVAGVSTAILLADRLSARLRHRARAAPPAAAAGDAGGAAVLDLVPDPHLCLDQHPAARRPAQRCAAGARHRRRPVAWLSSDTAIYIGIVYSYLPFMVLPLYAALEKMDETLARSGRRSRLPALEGFWRVTFPLSLPGVAAGALLCFIPIVGEFVIPDLLGGSRHADDRADVVDRVLRQPRLAGRLRDRDRAAGLLLVPILFYERMQLRALGEVPDAARASAFNVVSVALGLAFLYLPIAILMIYSFNASRLVTVWGGWSLAWYRELLHDQRHARARPGSACASARCRRPRRPCSARWPRSR